MRLGAVARSLYHGGGYFDVHGLAGGVSRYDTDHEFTNQMTMC